MSQRKVSGGNFGRINGLSAAVIYFVRVGEQCGAGVHRTAMSLPDLRKSNIGLKHESRVWFAGRVVVVLKSREPANRPGD